MAEENEIEAEENDEKFIEFFEAMNCLGSIDKDRSDFDLFKKAVTSIWANLIQ